MSPSYQYPLPSGMDRIPDEEIDARSDADIVADLRSCKPVHGGSEKNIWAYWHTGWDAMAPWTQRNVIGWVRKVGPAWTVRVLDGVPGSPANLHGWVGSDFFPPAMNEGRMQGRYSATHCADFVRLPLLLLHGGVWMDVGVLLTGSLDDWWAAIEDPTTPYEVGAMTFPVRPDRASVINTVICAKRNNELIRKWHDLFLAVWADADRCDGLHRHPLLRHLEPYCTPTDQMNCHNISVDAARIMDYGVHVLCLERLQFLICPADGFNGPEYFAHKMFLLPALREMWHYQQRTHFLGSKQLQILETPYEPSGQPDSIHADRHDESMQFVQDMLRDTLLMKFCHGPQGVMQSSLADLLDSPQHQDADSALGTFGFYFRYGAAHFRQKRTLESSPLTTCAQAVRHVDLFEPVAIGS